MDCDPIEFSRKVLLTPGEQRSTQYAVRTYFVLRIAYSTWCYRLSEKAPTSKEVMQLVWLNQGNASSLDATTCGALL